MALVKTSLPILLVVATGLLSSGPVAGDVLVTTDGTALETKGTWEIKGPLVVFRDAKGALSSIRLSDVDLAASKERTEAVKAAALAPPAPKPEPPPAPRRARFILTDADVGHVDPATLRDMMADPAEDDADEGDEGGEEKAGEPTDDLESNADAAPEPASSALEIASWTQAQRDQGDGLLLSGVVSNPTELFAANVQVTVSALNRVGEVIGEVQARLRKKSLQPGQQTKFTAFFPGIFQLAEAQFEIESFDAKPRPPEPVSEE